MKTQTKKIIELEAMKSDRFLLWIVIGSLPLLASNMYYVYNKLSVLPEPWRNRVSLGVALVLSGWLVLYTFRKNYRMAKYFAYFEALISAYYYIVTIGWDWDLLPAFGFTFILPAAMYHGSREIKQNNDVDDKATQEYMQHIEEKFEEKNQTIRDLQGLLHDDKESIKYLEQELERAHMEADDSRETIETQKKKIHRLEESLDNFKQQYALAEVQTAKKISDLPEIELSKADEVVEIKEPTGSAFMELNKSTTPDPIHDPIVQKKKTNKGENDELDYWERQKE